MKAVFVTNKPASCLDCEFCGFISDLDEMRSCILRECHAFEEKDADEEYKNCQLRHPLKEVSNDFYIYDRKYLFDHLDREIGLLKGTKAFEEFMKAREE